MALVYAFLADGLEEVECLAAADVLVRAGIEVKFISVSEKKEVTGTHGFRITADACIGDADLSAPDCYLLPGGQPGTEHLAECRALCDALLSAEKNGKRIAAICAAPTVPGRLGLLRGKRCTCYPGAANEEKLLGAEYTGLGVVTDGYVTTAKSVGFALDFGLDVASLLAGQAKADEVQDRMIYEKRIG
ncbi:MAG: DJ-1/PfpI family protein [Clostridium sp.]|nr:DJ-1/PfpI family protein [Clostridium sp.]